MNKLNKFDLIATGLAIFSMLFGAGNLVYPIKVGLLSGKHNLIGFLGFLITAVLLPLMGLVAMILYNGNYKEFFGRLGKTAGKIMIAICMIIIGPGLVIPRIVSVAQVMIAPFLPFAALQGQGVLSLFLFSIIFLGITFLGSVKENNIVNLLGYVISPILLISLVTVIVKGLLTAQTAVQVTETPTQIFKKSMLIGYGTLDLLGTIFFASIIITIIIHKMYKDRCNSICLKKLAFFGLKAGAIGVSLLAIIYFGMSFLGAYHGHGIVDNGQAFKDIVFKIIGRYGAAILGTAALMACLSTSIGLSAVGAEYIQKDVFKNKIGYIASLILVLIASIPLSTYGLNKVLEITGGPLVFIGYPLLIALTLCNILYKLFGFKYVKTPVLVTFIIAFASYYIF